MASNGCQELREWSGVHENFVVEDSHPDRSPVNSRGQVNARGESQMNKHLVFVYGSLRRGCAGAMTTRFPDSKFVADAKVSGSLYDLGSYPGLLLDESKSPVSGEVYEVDDETLRKLDDFEASSSYRRKRVDISLGRDKRACWVYEPDPEFYSLRALIPSGDWIEYARTKAGPSTDTWPDEKGSS
jgi:gamma-glutamylcyclotransferase (GGCT)/AIG2-like uncharacterized protein YtfP